MAATGGEGAPVRALRFDLGLAFVSSRFSWSVLAIYNPFKGRGRTQRLLMRFSTGRSNRKNYRNIFRVLMLSRIDRNVEFARPGAPVAHNKALRRVSGSRLWPCSLHEACTHAEHARTSWRTPSPSGRHTSRNRAVRTLPCCTTNESPSLSRVPSTLPSPSFPLRLCSSGHRGGRSQSRFVQSTRYAHIYRRYRCPINWPGLIRIRRPFFDSITFRVAIGCSSMRPGVEFVFFLTRKNGQLGSDGEYQFTGD